MFSDLKIIYDALRANPALWNLALGTMVFVIILLLYLFARKRIKLKRALNMVFLQINIPRKEDQKEQEKQRDTEKEFKEVVAVAEQLFSGLHSLHHMSPFRLLFGQEHLSFEYVVLDKELYFFAVVPLQLAVFVEKQITSHYPDSYIERVDDYNIFTDKAKVACAALKLSEHHHLAIKTYQNIESDPLNHISNTLGKLGEEEGAAIQITIKPIGKGWSKRSKKETRKRLKGQKGGWNPLVFFGDILRALFQGTEEGGLDQKGEQERVSPGEEEVVKAIENKATKLAFETSIRIVTAAPEKETAEAQLSNIASAFSQFASMNQNSFKKRRFFSKNKLLKAYLFRYLRGLTNLSGSTMILNTEELASIFHLPNIKYNRAPNIHWQNFKIAPAPNNLPADGLLLGTNTFRGETKEVYMNNEDRFRHFYVIGQTGTGKTSIFKSMLKQDIRNGKGVCLIDPHGDFAEEMLGFIPKNRIDDVIYFNPADTERPMGLNMLEAHTVEEKDYVALEAMNMMVKMFGEEIFSPRLQDYFRNGCLTLMDDEEEGGALTDLVRLFTDDTWQRHKVKKVKNPIVRSFWEHQMAATGAREKQEMIPYFAAKFGAFVTNTMIRNIIGQTKSAFDFDDVMNNSKILIVNLSKGDTGEINSSLMGTIIVNKLQMAALRRSKMPQAERKDFFLYVDEFQNFITESIESILSEARKYRLSLNIAHQYIDQLIDTKNKNEKIKDAVFGNVGSMMCYKISAKDAEYMAKEMAPVFSEQDLINLDKFKAVLKLSIEGQPSRPFNISPPNPGLEKGNPKIKEVVKQISRLKYGRDRDFVNKEILARIGA
ncbi:MAG: type IV secretory system conjugative DNA transfer family protein [Candidatus Gracilibacteria bacterium]|nr:type IV secretory system conjugative DNA transfer family protein [Candidatus Gracilibacteria bacterium]